MESPVREESMGIPEMISRVSSTFWRMFDTPKVEITINYAPSVPSVSMHRVVGSNTIRVGIDFDDRKPYPIDAAISERIASGMRSSRGSEALSRMMRG
jgi:hypothetical protein